MNLLSQLSKAFEALAVAGPVLVELEADGEEIKAKKAVTVNIPNIGGSIEGVPGKFTGTVTFTPDA